MVDLILIIVMFSLYLIIYIANYFKEKKAKKTEKLFDSEISKMDKKLEILKQTTDESERKELFKQLDFDLKNAKELFYKITRYEYE